MELANVVAVAVVGLLVGLFIVGVLLHKKQLASAFERAELEAKKIREQARVEADDLIKLSLKEAKEESRKRRQKFEEESKNRRTEISRLENKIKQREQQLDKKLEILDNRESELVKLEGKLQSDDQRYQRLIGEYEEALDRTQKTLQNIARISPEEAKAELIRSLEDKARKEAKDRIAAIEAQMRQEADERARAVVSLAVQRLASEYVSDSTISVVSLPSDDMKGRIIGREGRNIRAIEQATGVDMIIDDTPEAVIISCFNPVRREVAKVTLERLVADGRIHPARIEETAKRVEAEFEQLIRECGEQAAFDVGITDLHPELVKHLGRLRYRTTGQQTVLQHSIETSHICGILAAELNIDVKKAKRAGLLHDIGKAVDQESEGHHSDIGAEPCEKYDEHASIVTAIRLHHEENLTQASALTVALHTANILSSKRPGARREVLETYLKRLDAMEKLVKSFGGIEEAYVMQAGNEVRAVVSPTSVQDDDLQNLADDVAAALRRELTFPGQVRVTVVRQSQFADLAK